MIVRLIVFIAIFLIGWWIYRQFIAFKKAKAPSKQNQQDKASSKKDQDETMVRCEQCKTFTPRSHAIHDQDANAFCSKEHLQLFHKK